MVNIKQIKPEFYTHKSNSAYIKIPIFIDCSIVPSVTEDYTCTSQTPTATYTKTNEFSFDVDMCKMYKYKLTKLEGIELSSEIRYYLFGY